MTGRAEGFNVDLDRFADISQCVLLGPPLRGHGRIQRTSNEPIPFPRHNNRIRSGVFSSHRGHSTLSMEVREYQTTCTLRSYNKARFLSCGHAVMRSVLSAMPACRSSGADRRHAQSLRKNAPEGGWSCSMKYPAASRRVSFSEAKTLLRQGYGGFSCRLHPRSPAFVAALLRPPK